MDARDVKEACGGREKKRVGVEGMWSRNRTGLLFTEIDLLLLSPEVYEQQRQR